MKGWAWIPVALLAGLVIGAWPQRSALRRARAQIVDLEKAMKERSAGADQFKSVSRFLRIPDGDKTPRRRMGPLRERPSAGSGPIATNAGSAASAGTNQPTRRAEFQFRLGGDGKRTGGRQTLEDRIDEASDLWRMRSDVARSTFIANAELDVAQVAQFDVLVAAMNMRLGDRIEHWAEQLRERDEPLDPETGMRVINDLTEAMVVTYDEMDRTMPEGWRGESGSSVDLTDFIDPSVATPLIEVEDKIGVGPSGGGT